MKGIKIQEAMGNKGFIWDGDEAESKEKAITRAWLRTKANSIEGRTSEVQLNLISIIVLDFHH